jgi:hypothetical protein
VAPFHGNSAVETLHAILKDDPPMLPDREGVSTELERVIRHCLEKSPDARLDGTRSAVRARIRADLAATSDACSIATCALAVRIDRQLLLTRLTICRRHYPNG